MNKESLKSLNLAHSWLGLIISFILYIVFLAGSYSFFINDIAQWELGAHYPKPQQDNFISAEQVFTNNLTGVNVDPNDPVWLRLATNEVPYHDLMYSYKDQEGKLHSPDPIIHPVSGEFIYNYEDMSLGRFFRSLHINMYIPVIGNYLVGFISLFFFVALITGIFIHWRKLFSHFFKYRTGNVRDKTLDSHNVIGVIGLPFHLLFALTGVIFNLNIILDTVDTQIFFDGDEESYTQQTRNQTKSEPPSGIFMPMIGIDKFIKRSELEILGYKVKLVEIENWQNDNATIKFEGAIKGDFAKTSIVQYRMKSGEITYQNLDVDNAVINGEAVLDALHFASFSDYFVKVIFFFLGLGTCYVIISGNLLWIAKQEKKRNNSLWSINLVKRLSSSFFAGAFMATALCFLVTRLLPVSYESKETILCTVFYGVLLVCFIYSFAINSQLKVMVNILKLTGLLFISIPILDWALLSSGIITMVKFERYHIIIIELVCLASAVVCFLLANNLASKNRLQQSESIEINGITT